MIRSLSARIILGVVFLLFVVSVANFAIGLYVGDSIIDGSSKLVDVMQKGIEDKETALEQSVHQELSLETERLGALQETDRVRSIMKTEKEESFLHGKRSGLSAAVVTMIRASMMSGEASTTTDLIDTLTEDPNLASISLWRTNGVKALSDNATIDAVNEMMGDEVFKRRAEATADTIEGPRAEALQKAVADPDGDVTLETEMDIDGAETPVIYSYHVLKNTEECQGCHTDATSPRGVLEIAISRADLLALQQNAEKEIAALQASQAAETEQLRTAAETRVEQMKADVAELATLVGAKREELSGLHNESRWLLIIVAAVVLVVAVVFMTIALRRTLSVPLARMTEAMRKLSGGELDTTIPARHRKDEIGQMAGAVQVFKESMIASAELGEAQAKEEERKEERRVLMDELTLEFEERVSGVMKAVQEAAASMATLSSDLTETADRTNHRAADVTRSVENVSSNIETVAAATSELSSSIQEISAQVAQSSTEARAVADDADAANGRVRSLADSAERIGEVVTLIQGIAEQTNLLALNATIEAARAGEAGKGFAVVAAEVKELATQTARATEDIADQVSTIQGATQETVHAIQGIAEKIAKMSDSSSAIAAAVEEQGAATSDISRSVNQTSEATHDVTETIAEVSKATGETGDAADTVSKAVVNLKAQSEQLNEHVSAFLMNIKAV